MKRSGWVGRVASALVLCAAVVSCTAQGAASGSTELGETEDSGENRASASRPFTLVATGDIIPYPSIIEQAHQDAEGDGHDFTRILAGVKPVIAQADLAICHMETPYGDADGPFTGYPLFRSPPQLAESLRATGYDSCSTASNHILDGGMEGISRTLRAMDKAGLKHAGSAGSKAGRERPTLLHAGGATVAHLAYTYGTNGIPVPEDKPWAVNLIEPRRIIADSRGARDAGADIVIVSLHWGTEWQQKPNERQRQLAKRLTRSRSDGRRDIDLIIGTHNHVPQPYEKVNGTWVVYGLGDQVASFIPSMYRGNEGSMARFTFSPPQRDGAPWKVSRAEFLVSHSDTGPPFRVVRATAERYPKVHARVREAVLSRGAAQDGLAEGDVKER